MLHCLLFCSFSEADQHARRQSCPSGKWNKSEQLKAADTGRQLSELIIWCFLNKKIVLYINLQILDRQTLGT